MSNNLPSNAQSIPATVGGSTLASAADMLIVATFFTALLVPIAVIMFYFSTAEQRRRPVFILNVIALVFGLGLGGVIIFNIRMRISLRPLDPAWSTANAALCVIVPMVVQSILLVRVFAVYPPRSLSWPRIALVYGPFVVLKVARFTNICIGIVKLTEGLAEDPLGGLDAGAVAWSQPYLKAEWFLQLVDDTYASSLFLFRLRNSGALGGKSTRASAPTRISYESRLKTLTWIAVFNFVFPAIFNIVQLILIFRDKNYVHGVSVLFAANPLMIIGVLLATIWYSEKQAAAITPTADTVPWPLKAQSLESTGELESAGEASSNVHLYEFPGGLAKE